MRKLATIFLALLLAPLVGTVALSDFNYIGQGGGAGGLDEDAVNALIAAAGVAYAPAYSNEVACDPAYFDPGPPPPGVCTGAITHTAYFGLQLFQGAPAGTGLRLSPQDVKVLPWDSTDSGGPWTFYLCNIDALGGDITNCQIGVPGVYGTDGDAGAVGAELADINDVLLPMTCDDSGAFVTWTIIALDGWGNFVVGQPGLLFVNDDFYACGEPGP